MNMIRVEEAEKIILAEAKDYGTERIPFEQAIGRVLAADLKADRDLPPFNRVAMDGIAIRYADFLQGSRTFPIRGTQAAGDAPIEVNESAGCVEIMTGAALPAFADTIIRYEDMAIHDGTAAVLIDEVKPGQNIHFKGKDRKAQEVVAYANQVVTPALIGVAAAVGATELEVKKLPKVVIISTGDELVEVEESPTPYQIRRSNVYTVRASLEKYKLKPDLLHIPDNFAAIEQQLADCLEQYDVIILSGGISMGKFDYVPQVLEKLSVTKLFHKVQQRPGKPFWFGKHTKGTVVFALPGNPASTFMCLRRYVIPWLESGLGIPVRPRYAILSKDITFQAPLQYFLQVQLSSNELGQLVGKPLEGNGSGDFANLVEANAFMELPLEEQEFKQGEVYRVWEF